MRDARAAPRSRCACGAMIAALAIVSVAGCAVRPVTPPLTQFEPGGGYRWNPRAVVADNDPRTLLLLTFSGGGTRAAAFSYGVLEELRRTAVNDGGRAHRALDEVDLITGTSGGSFTALAYALYGERLFDVYEDAFLKRDVEGGLWSLLLNPVSWLELMSPGFGRSDLAADYYDEILFHGATYGDLLRKATPVAVVGATDVTTGERIAFTQTEFDFICADLSKFRLARAAAASSAVPVVLTPVTLDNRGGTCSHHLPFWLAVVLRSPDNLFLGNRADLRLRQAKMLEDSKTRPYIHLVDGSLSDNLALRGLIELLQDAMANPLARVALDIGRLQRVAFIIVNAQPAPRYDFDRDLDGPGTITLLMQSARVPIGRYSTESIAALQDVIAEWNARQRLEADARLHGRDAPLGGPLPAVQFSAVDVSFTAIADPQLRESLQSLPTSFALDAEAVDRLRAAGAQVLRDSPAFQELVRNMSR